MNYDLIISNMNDRLETYLHNRQHVANRSIYPRDSNAGYLDNLDSM